MLGNFSNFYCRLLTFFKINIFKKFFQEHYQSVNSLESDQVNILLVLIWVQTVCKGYQQMTKLAASKERVLEISPTTTPVATLFLTSSKSGEVSERLKFTVRSGSKLFEKVISRPQ